VRHFFGQIGPTQPCVVTAAAVGQPKETALFWCQNFYLVLSKLPLLLK
jgi:hypothetical protein